MQSKQCRSIFLSVTLLTFLLLTTTFPVRASSQASSYSFATLLNFNGNSGNGPNARLIQGSDGNLYGTTVAGGTNGYGTVFSISTQGALHTVYSFCSRPNCADGSNPYGGVVEGLDGNFYGTTFQGGANPKCTIGGGCGTVYKVTPQGVLTTLHSFDGNDGGFSYAGLVLAKDGQFYGTTNYGELSNSGTIFKISSDGRFTSLYTFCVRSGCPDGASPGGLVQDASGNFYGTTAGGGGSNDGGTVFKLTPNGTLTTLHRFCTVRTCLDGARPFGSLTIGTDGSLYATTYAGGANFNGTAYRISPSGTFKTIHTFSGSDGAGPYDGLVIGTDGNFYGTAAFGGKNYDGTIFTMTPAGFVTVLHDFDQSDGFDSQAGLTLATDGNFYGTTYMGGSSNDGVLFKLSVEDSLDSYGPRIRCPLCGCRPVKRTSGFAHAAMSGTRSITGGVCPNRLHQWTEMQCLSCSRWSPHSNWYSQWVRTGFRALEWTQACQ